MGWFSDRRIAPGERITRAERREFRRALREGNRVMRRLHASNKRQADLDSRIADIHARRRRARWAAS